MLLVLALFLAVSFSQLFPPNLQYTTSKVGSEWKVVPGTNGAANAMWEENRFINGWDKIHLTSNAQFSANDQAYAIGFLEGALLQKLTFDAWRTNLNGTNSNFPQKVTQFFVDNDAWTRKSVQQNPTVPYWIQVGLVLQQFDGLFDGYNQYAPAGQKIGKVDFLAYQAGAEVGDIFEATGSLTGPRAFDSHCSGLVKLVNNELYASHVTWSNFNGMLRTFKFMDTPFAPVRSMQYSGYPGNVPSGDDYYTTSSRLMIMETTNEIFNNELYKNVSPHSVLYWIRVTVATRMAITGEQWVNTFAAYNSGTYNNQWMVVDYKLYTPGKPLLPGTLWVAEQIPGLVEMDDKTSVLNSTGYWASYNIPYFPVVYKSSGYPAYYAKYGDEYSYSMCARAQIFRRDHGNVHDLPSMKHLMRYNKFQTDPLSLQDACRGISARCDLNDPWINATTSLNGYAAFGGIDCKITSSAMIATDLSVAVSGPTWQSQPVFAWTEEWQYTPHWSQPTVFAFDFVDMKP